MPRDRPYGGFDATGGRPRQDGFPPPLATLLFPAYLGLMETPKPSGLARIVAAALVALGIAAAGYLAGGRYEIAGREGGAYRLDRWTGEVIVCTLKDGASVCGRVIPAGHPLLVNAPDLSGFSKSAS